MQPWEGGPRKARRGGVSGAGGLRELRRASGPRVEVRTPPLVAEARQGGPKGSGLLTHMKNKTGSFKPAGRLSLERRPI